MDPHLAIIGLTSAIVGLYGTIRGGFRAMEEDSYLWRKYGTLILEIQKQSKQHHISLESWQNKWMLWDAETSLRTPDRFFEHFWTRDGLADIKTSLSVIEVGVKELNKRLTPFFSRRSRFQWFHHWVNKLKFVAKEKLRLHDLLDRLGANIASISLTADYYFEMKYQHRGATKEFIHRVGNSKRLIDLAVQSRRACDALYQHCKRSSNQYNLTWSSN